MGKSRSKTIAKNTLLLYVRMMVLTLISLYTFRVILKVLGVEDYGTYQAVGGIVGFMSFLNSALSAGSSRFITYALGKGDEEDTQRTFSTVFIVHLILALFVVILAETIGLWYFHHKMVIPEGRQFAAEWVYHISIITAAVNITQVPYTGCITAHERFNIYAYVSIVEAVLKLAIVYLLTIGQFDKLILYAILLFVVQNGIRLFYRSFCAKHFKECKVKWSFDTNIFKPIARFSGWSLFANITIALNNQGVLLLLNLFFSPVIVASRALSLQVDGVIKTFVSNFIAASNPQIIKTYAAGDKEASKRIVLRATVYSYYLMLILCVPICITANTLLEVWLDQVPEYAVPFLQLLVIQNLFGAFDMCFYKAFNAAGRLRENALLSPTINCIRFIVIYIMFRYGASPLALSYAGIITIFCIGLIAKPYLMVRYLEYKWTDFLNVIVPCAKVTVPTTVLALLIYLYIQPHYCSSIISFMVSGLAAMIITIMSIWFLGIDLKAKTQIVSAIKSKIHKK